MFEKIARIIDPDAWDILPRPNLSVKQQESLIRARQILETMEILPLEAIGAAWMEITKSKKIAGITRLGPGPGVNEVWGAVIRQFLKDAKA